MNEEKLERITIEISADKKKSVIVYCAEHGLSVKDFITMLIDEKLNKN